jgi:hypothetical protein
MKKFLSNLTLSEYTAFSFVIIVSIMFILNLYLTFEGLLMSIAIILMIFWLFWRWIQKQKTNQIYNYDIFKSDI